MVSTSNESEVRSMLQRMIFWLFKVITIFVPTILTYLMPIFRGGTKKTLFELMEDGQICFIVFSIAVSSITHTLGLALTRPLILFEVASIATLFLASLFSIAFYYWFNNVLTEKNNDDVYNQRRKQLRNLAVFAVLGIVMLLSFITEVFLYE